MRELRQREGYLFLNGGIVQQVTTNVSLQLAVDYRRWQGSVIIGYVIASKMLSVPVATENCPVHKLVRFLSTMKRPSRRYIDTLDER